MPFVANTPESRLGRSDSKNPNSTCRGITSNGRPCRRAIANANARLPAPTTSSLRPHARPKTPDPSDEALYCWQHKEQAGHASTRSSPGPRVQPILEERSSLDTLADRLGLVDLQEKTHAVKQSHSPHGSRPANGRSAGAPRPPKMTRPRPARTLDFCFCFSIPLDEVNEPVAPRPRPQAQPIQPASAPLPSTGQRYKQQLYQQQQQQQQQQYLDVGSPRRRIPDATSSPSKSSYRSAKSTASQTAQMKHFIPDTLDTTTASALMAELARPYAESEEPGYIYMFWLTPASQSTPPPVAAARSLLAPPSPSSNRPVAARARRASDVVSSFANQQNLNTKVNTVSAGTGNRKTMLLKIGRAANVQRRMNQWQRQCGYDIEMLRYYPYLPGATDSSPGPSPSHSPLSPDPSATPRTTPHCRRVERLIHIELTGLDLRADLAACGACGRDHREWFEVSATRDGIRKVDDVVRRWVEWDERAS